jgi:hypothetical protein
MGLSTGLALECVEGGGSSVPIHVGSGQAVYDRIEQSILDGS